MSFLASILLPALVSTAHATTTDVVGSDQTYNNNGGMLKVVSLDVAFAVEVQELRFAVYNYGSSGVPTLVLYKLNGDTFELVESVPATDLPTEAEGWATAAGVHWLLEPGATYAMGAYMPETWYYYYTDHSNNTSFGRVTGGYRYTADAAPPTFQADLEQYVYYMEIDSVDADVDDDGVIATTYGGLDCDDNDPNVGEASEEIPYDGIDQDCSGADLTDVDGDGQDAVEAGGPDCNDQDTSVAAGGIEVCGDGIDQDCDGSDLECGSGDNGGNGGNGGTDGTTDDTGGNGGNGGTNGGALDVSPASCGCATSAGSDAAIGLGAVVGFLALRRRRDA